MGSRAFCFLRASQLRVAGQVFSKRHVFVIPAEAGIQSSCRCRASRLAPRLREGRLCAGATNQGSLDAASASRRGSGVLEETCVRHPRGGGDPELLPLPRVSSGPPPSRGQALRGGDEPGVARRCFGRFFMPRRREGAQYNQSPTVLFLEGVRCRAAAGSMLQPPRTAMTPAQPRSRCPQLQARSTAHPLCASKPAPNFGAHHEPVQAPTHPAVHLSCGRGPDPAGECRKLQHLN